MSENYLRAIREQLRFNSYKNNARVLAKSVLVPGCGFPWSPKAHPQNGSGQPVNKEARKVILCIDDEAKLLMVRQMVLAAAGYSVVTAADGKTGLELFRDEHIDVVITDHLLPDISGTELAAEMKRMKPRVPIILLTGLADTPEGAQHADLVLTKGMPVPAFLQHVAEMAQLHSLKSSA
jgi:CheY-like chemotaxis protein